MFLIPGFPDTENKAPSPQSSGGKMGGGGTHFKVPDVGGRFQLNLCHSISM